MVHPVKIDTKELASALGMEGGELEAGHHLRGLIHQYARVQIPLDDLVSLRYYADILRGLAAQLDFISRRTDLGDTQALFLAQGEIKSVNYKMLHFTKSGKAK